MRGVTVLLALTVAMPALAAEEVWLAAPDDCLIWVDRSLDTVGVDWNGEWRDGRPDGYGAFFNAKSDEKFSGSWSGGCFRQGDRWATVSATMEECGF